MRRTVKYALSLCLKGMYIDKIGIYICAYMILPFLQKAQIWNEKSERIMIVLQFP